MLKYLIQLKMPWDTKKDSTTPARLAQDSPKPTRSTVAKAAEKTVEKKDSKGVKGRW